MAGYEFVARMRADERKPAEDVEAAIRTVFTNQAASQSDALAVTDVRAPALPADGSPVDVIINTEGGAVLSSNSFAVAEEAATEAAELAGATLVNFGIDP